MYIFSSEVGIYQKGFLTAEDIKEFNYGTHYDIFNAYQQPVKRLHRALDGDEQYPTLETLIWDDIPTEE